MYVGDFRWTWCSNSISTELCLKGTWKVTPDSSSRLEKWVILAVIPCSNVYARKVVYVVESVGILGVSSGLNHFTNSIPQTLFHFTILSPFHISFIHLFHPCVLPWVKICTDWRSCVVHVVTYRVTRKYFALFLRFSSSRLIRESRIVNSNPGDSASG